MSAVVLEKKPLPANGSYTQDMQDRFGYNNPVGAVSGEVYSDKAGTLYLEESDNAGTNWTQTATIPVSAGVTTALPWAKITKRWFRFRYVNGAAAQSGFVLVQQVEGLGFALKDSEGNSLTRVTNDVNMQTVLKGTATGGSNISITDTIRNFEPGMFSGCIASVTIDGVNYLRTILDNLGDALTIAPLPAESATATISGDNDPPDSGGSVLITVVEPGVVDYVVDVIEATEADTPTNAAFVDGVLTVTLGKNALGEQVGWDATMAANAIDALPEFAAIVTEEGSLDPLAEPVPFEGGLEPVVVSAGDSYEIIETTEARIDALSTQVGSLVAKIDNITNGTTPAVTQLSGSNVRKAFAITPNDTTDLTTNALSLSCTASGLAYVDFVDGGENIPIWLTAGYWNPVYVKRVRATNTTATGIVGQES